MDKRKEKRARIITNAMVEQVVRRAVIRWTGAVNEPETLTWYDRRTWELMDMRAGRRPLYLEPDRIEISTSRRLYRFLKRPNRLS